VKPEISGPTLRRFVLPISLGTFVVSTATENPQHVAANARLQVDTAASGFGIVRSLVFIAPDTALVVSHAGAISLLNVRNGQRIAVANVPRPVVRNEAGFFDVALHPDFRSNRIGFLSLAVGQTSRSTLGVMRFRLAGSSLHDTVTLLRTAAWDTSAQHYGGQLVAHGNHLFISIGDRYARQYPQDMNAHNGKILRVGFDGSVPPDNPFVGRAGVRPEIWTFGHRNPQGMVYDSATQILWETEHGPRHGDELNRIERGMDYGWPRVSWGWEYEGGAIGAGIPVDSQTPAPLWVWSPNVVPTGMHVYSGRAIPEWRGNILAGTMQTARGRGLTRLAWNGSRISLVEFLFTGQLGRVRCVTESEDGFIYVGNDLGQVLRLMPVR